MSSVRRNNYSRKEVRRLVEQYAELVEAKNTTPVGLRTVDRLLDLRRGIAALNHHQRQVIFLHGVLRWSQEDVASALATDQGMVSRRYAEALDWLHFEMNGGLSN